MSEKRDPPAYQEFAANILTQFPFRAMSLQDRGLLYTMRLECWVNRKLPSNPVVLSKVLGLPDNEVINSLSAVMPFFKIEGDFITCPELEHYRAHLDERKHKQSEGGKKGSARTNEKRNKSIKTAGNYGSSTSSSNSQVPRRGDVESLVQLSTVKQSQVQLSKEKDSSVDSFVKEIEEYEAEEGAPGHRGVNNGNREFVRL